MNLKNKKAIFFFSKLILLAIVISQLSCTSQQKIICPDGKTVFVNKNAIKPYKPMIDAFSKNIRKSIKSINKIIKRNPDTLLTKKLTSINDLLNVYSFKFIILLQAQINISNNNPCNEESRRKTEELIAIFANQNFEIEIIQTLSKLEEIEKFINNKRFFENLRNINSSNFKIKIDTRKKWQIIFYEDSNFRKVYKKQKELYKSGVKDTRIIYKNNKYYLLSKMFINEEKTIDYYNKINYNFENKIYINKIDDVKHKRELPNNYKNKILLENKLNKFFKQWESESMAISYEELNNYNDTIKEAYKLFSDFYKASNLKLMDGTKYRNDLDSLVPYFVVKNKMKIFITIKKPTNDREALSNLYPNKNELYIEINNFRPFLNGYNKKLLYLNKERKDYLNKFLGKKIEKTYSKEYFLNPNNPNALKRKRNNEKVSLRKFILKKYISFIQGWGTWRLYSRPTITKIVFDINMKDAYISYETTFAGGIAIFEKIENGWIIKYSKLIWVE